jgi:hypothetical protein
MDTKGRIIVECAAVLVRDESGKRYESRFHEINRSTGATMAMTKPTSKRNSSSSSLGLCGFFNRLNLATNNRSKI